MIINEEVAISTCAESFDYPSPYCSSCPHEHTHDPLDHHQTPSEQNYTPRQGSATRWRADSLSPGVLSDLLVHDRMSRVVRIRLRVSFPGKIHD